MTTLNGTFTATAWDEHVIDTYPDGSKLARAVAPIVYAGDFEGEGMQDYLLYYRADGSTGVTAGMQRVKAKIGDKQGTFAIAMQGTFEGYEVTGTGVIVAESGTGDFVGISGTYTCPKATGMTMAHTLEINL